MYSKNRNAGYGAGLPGVFPFLATGDGSLDRAHAAAGASHLFRRATCQRMGEFVRKIRNLTDDKGEKICYNEDKMGE